MSASAPITASQFLGKLGVDTHMPYTDGAYADVSTVLADLQYLGIDQVRDTISDGADGSAPLSTYIGMARSGIKFTFIITADANTTTATLDAELALIDQVNDAVPGSVVAVEGPNEINVFPIAFNGVGGLQGAVALQSAIYSAVLGDPNLRGVSVDYFTGYDAGGIAVGPNPETTSGLADDDNQHPYPALGQAPAAYVDPAVALSNENGSPGPAVYTETGYSTNGGTGGAVNDDVQAKYLLDLLMDDAKNGISLTYVYQLLDAYQPGSPQGDDGFGLFAPNGTAKPSAIAIHDLTSILADAGAAANTFTPTNPGFTITGLPATGNSLIIEKSNGAYDVVIWNEPQIWDVSTGTEISAPTVNVTVDLDATYQSVNIYDPLESATAEQTESAVNTVTVGVSDHPIIVEVEPGTVAPALAPALAPAEVIEGTPGEFVTTTAGTGTIVELGAGVEQVQSLGADTIYAGSGNSFVYANTDSGPVTIFGGEAGSAGTFVLNEGVVSLGAGNDQVTTYTGGLNLSAGSGSDQVGLDGGDNTITGGGGHLVVFENGTTNNLYNFVNGDGGGLIEIFGFNIAGDQIHLSGYAQSVADVLAAASAPGYETTLTLADNTRVILYGVQNLTNASFV